MAVADPESRHGGGEYPERSHEGRVTKIILLDKQKKGDTISKF